MASDVVRISFSIKVSAPGTISISNPEAAESLKLVATVRQESSPFPERAVTILTTDSVLDNGAPDTFRRRYMRYPTDTSDDHVQIYLYPFRYRTTIYPLGGVRDMRQRGDHGFITIPPLGQGNAEVTWSLAPEHLLRFYEHEGDLKERLKRFNVGQRFKIGVRDLVCSWWTWGSLQHDLRDKKFSRWALPHELPIVREAGQDEGDEVNRRLIDFVDRKDVGSIIRQWNLPGTPDPDDEEPPRVKEMRMEGWVFGEPPHGLELTCDNTATFEFVE